MEQENRLKDCSPELLLQPNAQGLFAITYRQEPKHCRYCTIAAKQGLFGPKEGRFGCLF